jgi:hypothetical protein
VSRAAHSSRVRHVRPVSAQGSGRRDGASSKGACATYGRASQRGGGGRRQGQTRGPEHESRIESPIRNRSLVGYPPRTLRPRQWSLDSVHISHPMRFSRTV